MTQLRSKPARGLNAAPRPSPAAAAARAAVRPACATGRAGRALALLALLACLAAPGAGAAAGPTRVQVVAKEFFFILSRRDVPPGPAIVELVNFGQDAHDLRLQRLGSSRVLGTPIIQPGSYYDLHVDLQPGTYELYCSVADHRALGMDTRLIVRRG